MSARKANFLASPLLGGLTLRREKGKRRKRSMMVALVLTSLVDAFSIILIYLLVAGQNGTTSTMKIDDQALPTVSQAQAIDTGTILKVKDGHYFIDGREVASNQIAQALAAVRQAFKPSKDVPEPSLVIQADKKLDFAMVTPIIRAGSITGFNQFKFAVMQSED
jgi:biopolymer transport protein ExbD